MTTLLQIRAWVLIIWAWSLLALGEERMWPAATGDRHLVEVTFALDDKPSTQDFHTEVTFWISEKSRGMTRWVYNWAVQGGDSPDAHALEETAKCQMLIKALVQPKDLPESQNQIVTVRWRDGKETFFRKFSIERVPSQVHEILTIIGRRDAEFSRLKFEKGAAEPDGAASRSQPIRSQTNQIPAADGSNR